MSSSSSPRIAIIVYSMYGHISKMAESVRDGIVSKGGDANIYQLPETLSAEVLSKTNAPRKSDFPIATPTTLTEFDAFLFGVPTRYGNMPAQLKTFWDATGKLWDEGRLAGKYAGVFVVTSGPGGGQETTVITFLSTLVHHGMIFVPHRYATGYAKMVSLEEVHGGSPWELVHFRHPMDLAAQASESSILLKFKEWHFMKLFLASTEFKQKVDF